MSKVSADNTVAAALGVSILVLGRLLPLPDKAGQILHIPSLCPFRSLTGIACPLCGMTRSVVYAMHGQMAASFAYHPLGIPLCIGIVVGLMLYIVQVVRAKPLQTWATADRSRQLFNAIAGVILLAWFLRLCGLDPLPI